MEKDETTNENEKKLINEEMNKVLYGTNYQKKKRFVNKKKLNKEISSPKKKRLLFRDMKILYGNMTEEEKKNLKNDENYKRFHKLLKDTRKKY